MPPSTRIDRRLRQFVPQRGRASVPLPVVDADGLLGLLTEKESPAEARS
jgi:hypothetical protein